MRKVNTWFELCTEKFTAMVTNCKNQKFLTVRIPYVKSSYVPINDTEIYNSSS